ncbi:toxin-antitoxin system HicB family antitoxin [Deinococcus cellulosilyticus]|uniref:Arc-like DNA binding domain-containing protein n=1 Tax=Deinococcus cellulosilyticus (strain DSM 18568 / NBRC 106333 / KACC 11606 / 5516J-15) TaxID=1223518 RepID=A0A511N4V9_DEIC1|nr:toxin-antitoxin system HicB family antitoxin [Deinococcus cellulosilyticus]GEM47451.1 hypothetical protein DC3_30860 [Deinococcus cellulosilyticus NBRC 106333 = KACC 11606]
MSGRKSFPLRIQPELFDVLERWASDEFRSVNGQIEYLLMEAARKAGRLKTKNSKETKESLDREEEAP